eukprot:1880024-Amphidinium_carterae.1
MLTPVLAYSSCARGVTFTPPYLNGLTTRVPRLGHTANLTLVRLAVGPRAAPTHSAAPAHKAATCCLT